MNFKYYNDESIKYIYCHDHSIIYFNSIVPSDFTINFYIKRNKILSIYRLIKLGLNLGFIIIIVIYFYI